MCTDPFIVTNSITNICDFNEIYTFYSRQLIFPNYQEWKVNLLVPYNLSRINFGNQIRWTNHHQ